MGADIDGGDNADTIIVNALGIVSRDILGGGDNDSITIWGGVGRDVAGQDGDDTIFIWKDATVDNDVLGGAGADTITNQGSVVANIDGGDDADTIINDKTGSVSNDILGGGGNDSITNSGTVNYLNGEGGNDSITNAKRAVRIYGGTGNDEIILSLDGIVDRVYADAGDDTVTWSGGTVSEFIQGDSDDDRLLLRPANNVIQLDYDGTPSSGTLTYDGDTVSWRSFELVNLTANSKDNIITVTKDSELNFLGAGAGADTITNHGSVTYLGGEGGNDSISHTGWAGYINGGGDHDTIEVNGTVRYDVNGDSGDDTVTIGLSGTVVGKTRGQSGTDTLTWVFENDSDEIAFAAKNPGSDTFTDSTGKTVTWATFEGLQTVLNSPPELDGTTYGIGTMDEDSDLTIDVSDFADKITDADATAVKGIAITAIIGNGTWEYSIDGGTTWTEVGSVSATNALLLSAEADDNNQLRYTGDMENGEIASVSFQAWDQSASTNPGDYVDATFTQYGLYSADTDTATITVTDVNDAPTVSAAISVSATEDDSPFNVDLLDGASDVDTSDTLNVDSLTLVSGDDSGISIGINSLTVDPSAYTALAVGESQVIEYSYNVNDGNGGSVAQTATITITGVNDAPTVQGDTHTLTGPDEDSTRTYNVSAVAGWIDDVDTDALKGIAIYATTGNGTWEYNLHDGNGWIVFGGSGSEVSETSALLLSAEAADNHRVRYTGDGENGETATLTIKAWDQTVAAGADQRGDASTYSATGAFSANSDTVEITVASVNDAPTLQGVTHTVTGPDEDSTRTYNVSAVVGWIDDVDLDALKGIAIYAVTGNGTWEYNLNDGNGWIVFGGSGSEVSETSALVLSAEAVDSHRVRYNGRR